MIDVTNRRILVIDDVREIHDDFKKILSNQELSVDLDDLEAELFGETAASSPPRFEVDFAFQGQEGLARVCTSLLTGRPYALAFVDMRMPPGWDGVETILRLWREDPRLEVVVCTAYSDHSWAEMRQRLDGGDRLLILKKPFDPMEVLQLSTALTEKWSHARETSAAVTRLEEALGQRTRQITAANEALQSEIREKTNLRAHQQLILSSASDAIFSLSAEGVCTLVNPAALTTLGRSLEQVEGQFMHAVLHGDEEHTSAACWLSAIDRNMAEGRDSFLRPDGTRFPVKFSVATSGGRGAGGVVVFRDLSSDPS